MERALVAPDSGKIGQQLLAIDGDSERFLAFIRDGRFELAGRASAQVWMLNLLRYEPGDGQALYQDHLAKAQSHVSGMQSNAAGQGGGLALHATAVHALRGPQFDSIAIM